MSAFPRSAPHGAFHPLPATLQVSRGPLAPALRQPRIAPALGLAGRAAGAGLALLLNLALAGLFAYV